MSEIITGLSSIIYNILSSFLYDHINGWKDRKSVDNFANDLKEWAIGFEKKNDGSIIATDSFYFYIKNYNVIEQILKYVLNSENQEITEKDFTKEILDNVFRYLDSKNIVTKIDDKYVVVEFITNILEQCKVFLAQKINLDDRLLLYYIIQSKNEMNSNSDKLCKSLENNTKKLKLLSDKIYEVKDWIDEGYISKKITPKWFEEQNRCAISNLGDRYSNELNIELQISIIMDAIEQNKVFIDNLNSNVKILEASFKFFEDNLYKVSSDCYKDVINGIVNARSFLEKLQNKSRFDLLFSELTNECHQLSIIVNNALNSCDNLTNKKLLSKFKHEIADFKLYLENNYVKISENPFVLITGNAGVGKSHFIAHHVSRRQREGKFSLFLLGQHFNSDENPIEQIKTQLNISPNESIDLLLESLNNYGKILNERVMIFIDALNEGNGKKIWPNYINGFVDKVKQYKWIGIIMSVRNTYESEIIPDGFIREDWVIKVKFDGFDDEDNAIEEFFRFYKVPLRINEKLKYQFNNPLFLKIYCKAYLGDNNLVNDSIEDIFRRYFIKINDQLKNKLEKYPNHVNLIEIALDALIEEKLKAKRSYLLYHEALNAINAKLNCYSLAINFLDQLINENIIIANYQFLDGKYVTIVYMSYELLDDYLAAKRIIEVNQVTQYTSSMQFEEFFSNKNSYYNWLVDDYSNQGIFEALIIQIPDLDFPYETDQYELFRWPDKVLKYKHIDFENAFYNSLLWRNPKKIKKISYSYIINETFIFAYESPDKFHDFWDILLQLTAVKGNMYNANFLFEHLNGFSLTEFNRNWVPYIGNRFDKNSIFQTLTKWAWRYKKNEQNIDDENLMLIAMNITWFLSSTNKIVRDISTKALVNLFEDNIKLLIILLKKFRYVKDLYILERLYCIAYGCVLRTKDTIEVKNLAVYLYDEFFKTRFTIKHVMIRDHMSGILEYSIHKNLIENIDIRSIRPPYGNSTNYYELTDDQIDKMRKSRNPDFDDCIGPDGYHYEDLYLYHRCQNIIIDSIQSNYKKINNEDGRSIQFFETENMIHHVLPSFQDNFCRMVIKEIFDMGYDYIRFGQNDLSYTIDTDESNISLGQKYEWIALNKILAIYLDNKEYVFEDFFSKEPVKYKGTWQLYFFRNIDASSDYFQPYSKDVSNSIKETPKDISVSNIYANSENFFEKTIYSDKWISIGGRVLYDTLYKEGFYVKPYLLDENEIEELKASILSKKFDNANSCLEGIYVRELYWSQAFKDLIAKKNSEKITGKKMSIHYLWDETDGATNSITEIDILNNFVINELDLTISGNSIEYYCNNELVCFNMFKNNAQQNNLLIKKNIITKYLIQTNRKIIWVISGNSSKDEYSYKDLICFNGNEYSFIGIH